jgi:hypothetical protein
MATFRTYAEVLRPDHAMVKFYEAGITERPPGLLLGDVLRRSGGIYVTTVPLTPKLREQIRAVAELTADEQLLKIAELSEVRLSLEHFRDLDPDTRIVLGCRLDLAPGESERLGWKMEGPPDPKTTLLLDSCAIPGASPPES